MIQYYNTEAEYQAAAKSDFESQISLVGESNAVHFDGRNVIVDIRAAKTGAIAVLDGNSALHFVSVDTYNSGSFMSNYTVLGVVAIGIDHKDFRGKLAIVHKSNASKQWSAIYSFKLTGYTLDGTSRQGTLNVRDASNWGAGVNYVIAYNASTVSELVNQLKAYFKANAPFTTQNWRADADSDGNITLSFLFTDYRQASNSGSAGFALTANLLPGIPASSAMLRKNGQRSGEGTISNWDRAIAYFSQDLNNASYNPTSPVTSKVRSYPICKPGYLGTSAYSGGDQCAALRAIYGDGEQGWLKFMTSFLPVRPTNYGPVGDKATYGDSLRNTYLMAGTKFTKQDNSVIDAFPAAEYCAAPNYNHDAFRKGKWQLPDADVLLSILSTIKYGTSSSRNADPVNRALAAIGGSAISNGSYFWSSSRCNASYAWYSYGYVGYMNDFSMYNTYLALPVALLDVSDSEL